MSDRALCPRVAFACATDVAHVLAIVSTEAISPSETPPIDGVFVENSLPEPAPRTSLAAAMTIMILLVKGRLARYSRFGRTRFPLTPDARWALVRTKLSKRLTAGLSLPAIHAMRTGVCATRSSPTLSLPLAGCSASI
jgi:hypothetical protein